MVGRGPHGRILTGETPDRCGSIAALSASNMSFSSQDTAITPGPVALLREYSDQRAFVPLNPLKQRESIPAGTAVTRSPMSCHFPFMFALIMARRRRRNCGPDTLPQYQIGHGGGLTYDLLIEDRLATPD